MQMLLLNHTRLPVQGDRRPRSWPKVDHKMCDWREIRMNVYGINWECVYYVVHVSANVPATPPYIYSPISVRYTLPPSGGADSRPPRVSCRCLAAPYNSLGIQIGGHRRTTDDIYIYSFIQTQRWENIAVTNHPSAAHVLH